MRLLELLCVITIILILVTFTTSAVRRFNHIWSNVWIDYQMYDAMIVEAMEDGGHRIERITQVQDSLLQFKKR